jgi:hypothetical protein
MSTYMHVNSDEAPIVALGLADPVIVTQLFTN